MEAFDELVFIKQKNEELQFYLKNEYHFKWCFDPSFDIIQKQAIK